MSALTIALTTAPASPVRPTGSVTVHRGPALLAAIDAGPGLAAHTAAHGPLPRLTLTQVAALTEELPLRGRGGAGYPFARKLTRTAQSRGRAVVVVNLGEGEPASLKDGALATVAPHLVLDGAVVAAGALGCTEVHLALPGERPEVGVAMRRAVTERGDRDGRVRWRLHDAEPGFVSGQSSAVLELLAGRANLPVTSWRPSAESGHRGRPTLLSNAETYAHLGLLALRGLAGVRRHGTASEPGTTLLTVGGDGPAPSVLEVGFGTPWERVLSRLEVDGPVLLGGYHGIWAAPGALRHLTVSPEQLGRHGLGLGAGVVLPVEGCPVERTADLVGYLARESAGRCGPCFNGLPALATALDRVRRGVCGPDEVVRLADLVDGRGACAHPDGTVRLVRSLLAAYGGEVAVHAQGGCGLGDRSPREVTA